MIKLSTGKPELDAKFEVRKWMDNAEDHRNTWASEVEHDLLVFGTTAAHFVENINGEIVCTALTRKELFND